MKKNFLITADLFDTWEPSENNVLLGKWCEFDLFKSGTVEKDISKKNVIIKNKYHWNESEKKIKDFKYIKENLEYLLKIISEKLSKIHEVKESEEYWRIIIFTWLSEYVVTMFDRWENIRTFFNINNTDQFYSHALSLDASKFVPKNHANFTQIVQNDEWNHLIYLRLFNFLNIKNLHLIKDKKINIYSVKKNIPKKEYTPIINRTAKLFDIIISKVAFKFNRIIFESFLFPKKEYLKICLKHKLIPSKYSNLFNFDVKKNNSFENNIRNDFKKILSTENNEDKFIQFLLLSIHKDIPKSYLENFTLIKNKIKPYAKQKKIIFSMHSIDVNDNFKIYIAETKKVGSKYIHAMHGGGLTLKMNKFFGFFEKICDRIIKWDKELINSYKYDVLSPTLPSIKLKKNKNGNNCSIIFVECLKYHRRFNAAPTLEKKIVFFNDLTNFVESLNTEIKSKIIFRAKKNHGYNSEKKFSDLFGKQYIDKVTFKNTFEKTILKSKLIIVTYPETAFSQSMYSNTPTILLIKKNQWTFTEAALSSFEDLKINKIAFEDFDEAKNHINKYWHNLDSWWNTKNVQLSRKMFLKNFFNVRSDWFKEWSDYINLSKQL